MEGLKDRRPKITRRKRALTFKQEKAFLERVEKGTKSEENINVFHLRDLQAILKKEFSKNLTVPGIWAILRRCHYATLGPPP
ncbi:hypothetical protein [Neochlamydia sp. S13]|uniref:hypothetical protein n=1 Tax=Neochlamydia sp. S13 TaxID=1353976 RepID=UPI000FD181D3|nr:hypothetical protein [Neochlamydia sp. S13]BBI18059.1 hypothetical protein NCS13_1_1864 [Neochlamydia sp. S13]